jgi:hypothetical protein
MERKELYAKIQQLGLQEEVKNTYGKNYTMVSNDNLKQIIWNYDATHVDHDPYENSEGVEEVEEVNTSVNDDTTTTENAYEAACLVFLGILKDSGKLDTLLGKL